MHPDTRSLIRITLPAEHEQRHRGEGTGRPADGPQPRASLQLHPEPRRRTRPGPDRRLSLALRPPTHRLTLACARPASKLGWRNFRELPSMHAPHARTFATKLLRHPRPCSLAALFAVPAGCRAGVMPMPWQERLEQRACRRRRGAQGSKARDEVFTEGFNAQVTEQAMGTMMQQLQTQVGPLVGLESVTLRVAQPGSATLTAALRAGAGLGADAARASPSRTAWPGCCSTRSTRFHRRRDAAARAGQGAAGHRQHAAGDRLDGSQTLLGLQLRH